MDKLTADAKSSPDMKVRLPPDLREKVAGAARESRRSLNSEIVARLEASFAGAGNADPTDDIALGELRSDIVGLRMKVADLEIQIASLMQWREVFDDNEAAKP